MDDQRREQLLKQLAGVMDSFGWGVMGVGAGKSPDTPPFTYTYGLSKFPGAGELVMFGMDQRVAASILNSLGEDARAGRVLAAGQERTDLLVGDVPLRLIEFPRPQVLEFLTTACALFDGPTFSVTALQVVWPDGEGRWPWQLPPGDELAAWQPVYSSWPGA